MRAASRAVAAAVLAGLGACTTFQDPTIVVDLRVIGMTAEPPEQIVDLDPKMPPKPDALLAQLSPTYVCATIADPARNRELHWSMTACLVDLDLRCDPEQPQLVIGEGLTADPEADGAPARICSLIEYDANPAAWIALLTAALEADVTSGLGGIDYAIELRLAPLDAPPTDDVYSVKQARVSARFPADKQPNHNPSIADLQVSLNSGIGRSAPRRRCTEAFDETNQFTIRPGDVVTLYPVEPDENAVPPPREEFVVPTLDGDFETYTETLSYQWLGTAGVFADPITGGPPDIFGNQTLLGTDWTAPDVIGPSDVSVWVIQRDERYGASVRETCLRVTP